MQRIARRGHAASGAALVAVAMLAGFLTRPAAAADEPAPAADPSTSVTFLVGLPFDHKGLAAASVAASTPGVTGYRRYLTVRQAAYRFGASAAAQARLAEAAAAQHLSVRVDDTRLFARVTGSVAAWQQAMGATIRYDPATAGSAQWSDPAPVATYWFGDEDQDVMSPLPAALEGAATWFLPSYSVYYPSLDVAGTPPPEPVQPRVLVYPGSGTSEEPTNNGTPLGTTCLASDLQPHVLTPDQMSTVYGLTALQRTVATTRPRIAVLSIGGGFAPSDLAAAASCFGYTAPRVDVRLGDGVPSPIVSLSGESALDLQTVSWAAHDLDSLRFVQVLNDNASFVQAYALALTGWPTPPDVITNSWGQCETQVHEGGQPVVAIEALLQMAAVVGTSTFVASGDRGSSVCQSEGGDASQARPTVGYPASSPNTTAVGGTQLDLGAGNARVGESVWNSLQYGAKGNAVATGGASVLFNAPAYQRPLSVHQVRTVPDISAQAGVTPGTAIYYGGTAVGPAGGTSQASPLVAAGFAMISAQLRAQGKAPLGFVNPWIYRLARTQGNALYDVTIGDNQYPVSYAPSSVNIPACCQAQPGYDMASGLGAPQFDALAGLADS